MLTHSPFGGIGGLHPSIRCLQHTIGGSATTEGIQFTNFVSGSGSVAAQLGIFNTRSDTFSIQFPSGGSGAVYIIL